MIHKVLQTLHRRSFLRRLIFAFLSILSLATILAIGNILISSQKFESQINDKIEENIKYVANTIDTKVETVQKMALSFFRNDSVQKYFRRESDMTIDALAEQWRICRVLTQSESLFSDFVDRYYVFYTDSDKVYTNAGVYTKSFFFEDLNPYKLYPKDYWSRYYKNNTFDLLTPTLRESYWKGNILKVIPVIYAENIQGNQAVFIADINCEEITEILDQTAILDSIQSAIIMDGNILTYSGNQKYSPEVILDVSKNIEVGSGKMETKINGINYRVFYSKSNYSSLTYLAIAPMNKLSTMIYSSLYYSIALSIIVILCCLFLSIYFLYRIYKPFNNVLISIKDDKAKQEYKDEFTYLQNSICDMVEENNSIQQQLKQYGDSYVEHQMLLLLNGIPVLSTDKIQEILRHQYKFIHKSYICFSILFDFTEEFYENISTEAQEVITEKFKVVLQTIISMKRPCYTVQIQSGLYVIIINCPEERDAQEIKSNLGEMEPIFHEDSRYYHIHIGYDSKTVLYEEMTGSYNHAMTALRNTKVNLTFDSMDYQDLSCKNKISFTFYDQKKIVNCINAGNNEKLLQVLTEILEVNQKKKIAYTDLLELYRQIFYVGQRCMEEHNFTSEDIEEKYRIHDLSTELHSKEEVKACKERVLDYLQQVLKLVADSSTHEDGGIVYKIKQYIEVNYTLDLSLDRIADEYSLSSKYVSKVFKQKTGENITDYIDRIRIEHSKILLATTNKRVGDIALEVGIESRTTFFRVFRKLEGVTPNEYRSSLNNSIEQ